ncbi:Nucleoredoxin-like protein 1 [Plecturocebus cupreus]
MPHHYKVLTCKSLRRALQAQGTASANAPRDVEPPRLTCPPRRDLGRQFSVERLPAVVVLKPDGAVLTRDGADEIQRLGTACFANWQEAAEVLDRNFLLPEDLEDQEPRSLTECLRRRKYRVEKAARGGRDPGEGAGRRAGPGGCSDPLGRRSGERSGVW